MLKLSPCAGLALVLLLLAGAAEAASPRDNVDGIARAIEERYFDVDRGAQIAADLRAAAAKGEFDALKNNREFASALSARLRPLDGHFAVNWSAPAAASATTPAPPAAVQNPQRRANYGIRRVEVQPGNIGYIDIREFASFQFGRTDQPARQAIEAALQLTVGTDALVIDLRQNRGGSPAMVGYLSSAFTPKGADIYNTFHSRSGTRSEAPADWYPAPRLDIPLYILISGRTGSAAEAFAYTMQNAKRGIVVGEASIGAANPGQTVDAGNGFSVFVADASPINPISKTNWEGRGVQPDVTATPAMALETAKVLALEAVLRKGLPPAEAADARWALEALRAEAAPEKTVATADYVGRYGELTISTSNGRLSMQRGRRPAAVLLPLGEETFSVMDNSSHRLIFERDAKGAVTAAQSMWSDGAATRYRRGG